jgi:hypothetical protein
MILDIKDMSSDIQKQVAEKLYDGKKFSLQLDDSTDISQKCQLLSYIRFLDGDSPSHQYSLVVQRQGTIQIL